MILKTSYRADVFEGSRKYEISTDAQGKSEILDVTAYTQEGDVFGAEDINAITVEINKMQHTAAVTLPASGWSAAAPYTQTVPLTGITAGDSPILVKRLPEGAKPDQAKAYNKAFGMIDDGDTGDGTVTFWCYNKKPTIDLAVGLKGV